jgi:hypothetical protein
MRNFLASKAGSRCRPVVCSLLALGLLSVFVCPVFSSHYSNEQHQQPEASLEGQLKIGLQTKRKRGEAMWGWGKRALAHRLDQALFHWTKYDPFRVRDLLNGGCLILGRAGSGKTSSSGRTLMQAIVSHPQSAGLILAAKPEDVSDIQAIFRKAERLKDLIVFDADGDKRCNFFAYFKRPRDVVQFVTTMSEVLKRGDSKGGGESSRFYDTQEERTIYDAVAALQAAKEPLSAPNLHEFIMTAGRVPEELDTPQWRSKYHCRILERGFNNTKTPLEEHDFQLCLDFWLKEWPALMDAKTRGNILAGVQGTLHTMNTGIVREMVSGATTCSPADVLAGKWVLVNFPPSTWGAAGQLISTGWKQLMELAILEREFRDGMPFVTIWADEFSQFCTKSDAHYICQARSHGGSLCVLLQSVASIYAAMPGDGGRHFADSLLANFSHTIAHACDPVSSKFLASKLGRRKEILYSGSSSPKPDATVWEQICGHNQVSASFSEHYEQVLQDQEFMVGRTGGPANNYLADAIVIRSGEPFADGRSFQRVTFSQR